MSDTWIVTSGERAVRASYLVHGFRQSHPESGKRRDRCRIIGDNDTVPTSNGASTEESVGETVVLIADGEQFGHIPSHAPNLRAEADKQSSAP